MRIHSRWNRLGLSPAQRAKCKKFAFGGKKWRANSCWSCAKYWRKKKKTRKISIKPFGVGLAQRAKRKKSILAGKIDTDKSVNWVGPLLCDIDVSLVFRFRLIIIVKIVLQNTRVSTSRITPDFARAQFWTTICNTYYSV